MTIEMVRKSYGGVEYSLEKTHKHNTEYLMHGIECGERFCSTFFAPAGYKKAQLMSIGETEASGWGGSCTSVSKTVSEQQKFNRDCSKYGYTPQDYKKEIKFPNGTYKLTGFKGKHLLLEKNGEQFQIKVRK